LILLPCPAKPLPPRGAGWAQASACGEERRKQHARRDCRCLLYLPRWLRLSRRLWRSCPAPVSRGGDCESPATWRAPENYWTWGHTLAVPLMHAATCATTRRRRAAAGCRGLVVSSSSAPTKSRAKSSSGGSSTWTMTARSAVSVLTSRASTTPRRPTPTPCRTGCLPVWSLGPRCDAAASCPTTPPPPRGVGWALLRERRRVAQQPIGGRKI